MSEEKKDISAHLKKEKGEYWIIASSSDTDRDNEIILPSSFTKSIDPYMKKNPVILWAHDYSKPPVGKAIDYKITDNELMLKIMFADTEFGKEIKYLYDNGFLNSFSVGFIPKEYDYDKSNKRVFTENEILETSAVPVPANAAATMIRSLEAKGIKLDAFKSLYESTPPDKSDEVEIKKQDEKIKKLNKLKRKYLWI